MDQYTLSEMMTLFVNHGILFCLETEHAIYQTPGVNEFFDKRHNKEFWDNVELQRFFELKRQEENRIPVSQFDFEKTGVTKIGFIAPDPIAFYDCVKYIAPMFNIVTFSKYEDDFINGEIILKNCTKADGVKRVVDYYRGDMKDGPIRMRSFAGMMILFLGLLASTVGSLGKKLTMVEPEPVMSMAQGVAMPGGIMARLDLFLIAFWIVGGFCVFSGYLFYGNESIKHAFSKGRIVGLSL